jgi:hypothetical protein
MKKQHAIQQIHPKRRYRIAVSGILATGLAASLGIAVTAAQPGNGSKGDYGVVRSANTPAAAPAHSSR